MQYYIYKITNRITHKCYIGQHKLPNKPEAFRRYLGKGLAIREAIKKYGKENFDKTILEYIDDDEKHSFVSEREKYYINLLNTMVPNGYNISPGGEGGCTKESARKGADNRKKKGYVHSAETRMKISQGNRGKSKGIIHRKHLCEHHHLRTLHTIIFENGDSAVQTYDSIRTIAKQHGTNETFLRRSSKRNVYVNGIKLADLYDANTAYRWKQREFGVFYDPAKKEYLPYRCMIKRLPILKSTNALYSHSTIWDFFDHFENLTTGDTNEP